MDFAFFNRPDYVAQLQRDIAATKAGDRVLLAAIAIDTQIPAVSALLQTMTEAAARGVHVTLMVDAYMFLLSKKIAPGPLWFGRPLNNETSGVYGKQYRTFQRIEEAGGTFVVTNIPKRPFSTPFAGRSHVKAAVVNNVVYTGGANLNNVTYLDIMLRWHDKAAADWIYGNLTRLAQIGNSLDAFGNSDQFFQLNQSARLLLDAGKPGQSRILGEAYDLIDQAEKLIFITCQYFPGGETGKRLRAAYKRGVQIHIAYSHHSVHGAEAPGHLLYAHRERTRLPQSFFSNRLLKGIPKLHAKVLCTEKGAIVGSHNFVTQGVSFGTTELALRYDSPAFSNEVKEFMLEQIHTAVSLRA